MDLLRKALFRIGCLSSLAAPALGLMIYPRAKWLFLFLPLCIALGVLDILMRKDPRPSDLADRADRILAGTYGGYEIDDYEHLNPKKPNLKKLWQATLSVHMLPEEWVALDEAKKSELRELIREIRELPNSD